MRILQVIHSVDPRGGGPIEGIRQLAPALARVGVEMEVLSLDAPGAPGTADFPVPLFTVGPSWFVYGYTARAIPWLRENRSRYDAIIVNGLWQYAGLAVRRALHGTSTPYYVYAHGMLDPWFQRRYPLKHLKKSLYWRWCEHPVLRDAAAVLFTSEEEKLEARKSFRPYQCREHVTGYGIAPPQGNAADQRARFLDRYPEWKGKRLMLFLGRIHEKKGCDLLLRAWKELLQSSPLESTADLHLIMAGPAESDYGAAMKRLTRELGLEATVSWPGMLTGDMKWGSLHAADAFVLPSHQENFGISVVEALACGVPTLVSNKVNIWREIVEDNAGVVKGDNLADTWQLMRHWLSLETAQKERMRANARRCFESRFDIARTAETLTALLAQKLL